jgi:hypothetical protein
VARAVLFSLSFILIAIPLADAQQQSGTGERTSDQRERPQVRYGSRALKTATIHWQDVPLRDAVGRIRRLFDEEVFVDRRLDPNTRITLDATATGAGQAVAEIAAKHGWGSSRVGDVTYLGPTNAARYLSRAVSARNADVAKLPPRERREFEPERKLDWPRLAEPRELVAKVIESANWRVESAELIPHDLWATGQLSDLTLTERLTLLLIGFDLTFELQPAERTVRIVPQGNLRLLAAAGKQQPETPRETPSPAPPNKVEGSTKQVYSLRVEDKPVGAVTRELARRLNWRVEFDEAAIRGAGRSLDARISFTVEEVGPDELLHAVLAPAGLTFRRNGERIIVMPREP